MFRAIFCPSSVLVGSSILLYLIDDARLNKNQEVA